MAFIFVPFELYKDIFYVMPRTLSELELLAPAGGMAQAKTALRFGADALYLACDRFGMRQRADNFTFEEIETVVALAHAQGAKVYVTLNTVMDNADIAALPPYLEALAAASVDAFIVSDLGAFSLAQRYAPQVELHVSTQASVSNFEAARRWYDLGAARVVLAREMSLEDIAELHAHIPDELELEAFVHGAMCMAVSGRCLISAALTGRSGNKGFCTQPCRWNYALVEETRPNVFYPIEEDARGTYLMNAQDLNMIEHLDELAAAGVDSIKIEGRNKRSFYVATVVHAYRQVLDGASPETVLPELYTISHRPYGTGFFYGQPSQSPERDGYVKECLHVATVVDCEPTDAGGYEVSATCHNRFFEGGALELLAPGRAVVEVIPQELTWIQTSSTDPNLVTMTSVDVANRASETYRFRSSVPMNEGDFLRVRLPEEDGATAGSTE